MSESNFPGLAAVLRANEGVAAAIGVADIATIELRMLIAAMRYEGKPITTLTRIAGASQSTGSRTLAKLGRGLKKKPGLGLIEVTENPDQRQEKLVRLTIAGKAARQRAEQAAYAAMRAARSATS